MLDVGDELFFYTDGVTEATNVSNELYGEERIIDCLDKYQGEELNNQLIILKNDIDSFVGEREPFDDITIMAVRVTE